MGSGPSDRCRDKRAVFEALLERGIAAVHLDPRREGVQVPPWLTERPVLVLNFSLAYRLDDFVYDDEMAFASLSFAGRPHPCRIPWPAVFAITDDERNTGGAWPEDLPAEARAVVAHPPSLQAVSADEAPVSAPVSAPAPEPESPPSGLRVIRGGAEASRSSPRRDHLRRIK